VEKDIKILVVDDTVTYRQILSRIVSGFENVEVIGVAPNGKIALSKIELNPPDVVLLDVFMPVMDGLETLERIRRQYPNIDVIMLSGVDQENANLTMKALGAGALDFIPKPKGDSPEENAAELRAALSRLILMARTRKYSRQARKIYSGTLPNKIMLPTLPSPPPDAVQTASPETAPALPKYNFDAPPAKGGQQAAHPAKNDTKDVLKKNGFEEKRFIRRAAKIDAVVIGVSTGGPGALQEIIPKLDADFPVPILAVQHMPPMFTASLADRLRNLSKISVIEAKEGNVIEKGVMYIAPGGRHTVVKRDRFSNKIIGLIDSPPVNSCRPSVDVLFLSAAMVYKGNVLAVILTGMGNDGLSGTAALRREGAFVMVQDEKSSVIWGMPGSVVEAQLADEIVPLDRIAARITQIVRGGQA
jgi:two-component system chemotaxis response regulator CheB